MAVVRTGIPSPVRQNGYMPVPQSLPTPERLLLRDSVQHRIRSAIMDGTVLPGERLQDDALIAWFGVSRTPIREALAALAQAGLVEMAANRYTRVASPTAAGRRDAFTSIGVLYGGVILLALSGASRPQQDRLARSVTSSALCLGHQPTPASITNGRMRHRTISYDDCAHQ
ncbi:MULTISPECIES: GntR family transcriptional regulator [unclassified Curtobacterium]|uniref:GntR family transcriptional regulator n=1 Tax=unclassified Curtobacterium TaxID=257496 RepID=UPI003806D61A